MLRSVRALSTRGVNRRDAIKLGLLRSTSMLALPRASRAEEATPDATPRPLTDQERGWLGQASRADINGWIRLQVGGESFARGFQHGYLVAAEYADAIRVYEAMTYQTMGFDYAFFVENAVEYHTWKITPELTREMEGIAAGLTAAGVPTTLGANAPDDPRIRNVESSDTGYNDVRQQTGARRVRWPQLLAQYEGRIVETIGQTMLGESVDPYLGYINPSRTICSHDDKDPMYYVSDPDAA